MQSPGIPFDAELGLLPIGFLNETLRGIVPVRPSTTLHSGINGSSV